MKQIHYTKLKPGDKFKFLAWLKDHTNKHKHCIFIKFVSNKEGIAYDIYEETKREFRHNGYFFADPNGVENKNVILINSYINQPKSLKESYGS